MSNSKVLIIKRISGMQKLSNSLFSQLCTYVMGYNTHDKVCPRYLPKQYFNQVSKRFEKHFLSYCVDKLGHPDRCPNVRMAEWTDGQTHATTMALRPGDKNCYGWNQASWSAGIGFFQDSDVFGPEISLVKMLQVLVDSSQGRNLCSLFCIDVGLVYTCSFECITWATMYCF